MQGTVGFVTYSSPGGDFLFRWSIPYFGNQTFETTCPNEYKIEESIRKGKFSDISWTVVGLRKLSHSLSTSSLQGSPISTDWRRNIEKASRASVITLENKTQRIFKRRNHRLLNGVWNIIPPEIIEPGSKCTFVSQSQGFMKGTAGDVFYSADGVPSDFQFSWSNPKVGEKSCFSWYPSNFRVEWNHKNTDIDYISFWIIENQDQKKNSSVSIGEGDKNIKLVTLNCGMLPDVLKIFKKISPITRATKISEVLIRKGYNIICFQEMFSSECRKEFQRALGPHYPYMISQVGSGSATDSGLFFASNIPIEWNRFKPFANAVGSDSFAQKGVLGVRLDVSSLFPDTNLYVFTTNLQANPDTSVIWKLSGQNISKVEKLRIDQLDIVSSFITETIVNSESSAKNIGIVLCGDFNILAETLDQDNKVVPQYTQIIQSLANQYNANEIHLTIGSVWQHINSAKIPIFYLSHLRSHLSCPRNKLVILIEMVSYLIKQDLIKKVLENPEDKDSYRSYCWHFFELFFGHKNPSTYSRSNSYQSMYGSSDCPLENSPDEVIDQWIDNDEYWKNTIKHRITAVFDILALSPQVTN
eukprot:TRINITY_DN4470_c0_g1_i1.p1 TRINITY_DN4470_c0_g1~~TRINITY_DN4470_c0_g1_i1.p1  ORF type:complete len:585 (-),score=67.11 TRINITY_DN4470_c0_g1_i1:644-2398(-)